MATHTDGSKQRVAAPDRPIEQPIDAYAQDVAGPGAASRPSGRVIAAMALLAIVLVVAAFLL